METTTHRHSFMVISTTQADHSQQLYNVSHIPNSPLLPDYPDKFGPSTAWMIDMNYLMPFSVMLMILCVLLLILCYLRHRMRQRRQLQRELRLSHIMHSTDRQQLDDFGLPVLPDRMVMMYPPTYEDAMLQNHLANSPLHKRQPDQMVTEQPPPYTEYHHPGLLTATSCAVDLIPPPPPPPAVQNTHSLRVNQVNLTHGGESSTSPSLS